jgi:PAB1-binding protein PBP1
MERQPELVGPLDNVDIRVPEMRGQSDAAATGRRLMNRQPVIPVILLPIPSASPLPTMNYRCS